MGNIEIGKFFKQNMADFKQEPPKDAFEKIIRSDELKKFDLARKQKKMWGRILLGAIVAVTVIIGVWGWVASSDEAAPQSETKVSALQKTESDNLPRQEMAKEQVQGSDRVTPVVYEMQNAANQEIISQQKNESIVANKESSSPKAGNENVVPLTVPQQKVKAPQVLPVVQPVAIQENAATKETMTPPPAKQELAGPFPTEPLRFSHDTTLCRSSKLTLFVKNAQQVYWNIGLYGETIEVYPEQTYRYVAHVTKFDGTDTTIVVQVNVFECKLYIPNAFSPNGDGLNDEFLIQAPEDVEFTNFEMSIFETSGRLIFHSKNITQGWDGTYLGQKATQSSYLYIITYKDKFGGKHYEKGQVYLYR